MRAKCLKCGEIFGWRNQRGAKMPKVCICGGELVKCDWEGNLVVQAPQPKRVRATCSICGRKAMLPGRLKHLTRDETFVLQARGIGERPLEHKTFVAGTVVCIWHESVEMRRDLYAGKEGYNLEPYPVFV